MAIAAVVAVATAAEPLVAALKVRAAALKVGPGDRADTDMGPLITREHRDKVKGYIDAGVAEGAALVLDGRDLKVAGREQGFFLGPTLFDRVTAGMTIYKEEIFGPVLIVLRVATLEDAIALINANPFANGTAIFTRSGAAARRFEHDIEVGMVGVNIPIPVPMAFFSFGGWKASLFGDLHMHGMEGVQFYTRTKVVTTRWPVAEGSSGVSLAMPTHK
jgi:malonate-semialdehyde dehydrogenase (acetylating)/methylmalonate-semialdehyde dehydrogenase